MKSILCLGLLTASLTASGGHDDPKTLKTARPAKSLAMLGRCSGDAGCSACSNCSACGHCAGGGGTCGVCASYATPVRTYRAPARTRSMTKRSYSGGGSSNRSYAPVLPKIELVVNYAYYVYASTLNLRAEPSADAEVLRVLNAADIVIVLKVVDEMWVKVTARSVEHGDIQGYVARAYLAK